MVPRPIPINGRQIERALDDAGTGDTRRSIEAQDDPRRGSLGECTTNERVSRDGRGAMRAIEKIETSRRSVGSSTWLDGMGCQRRRYAANSRRCSDEKPSRHAEAVASISRWLISARSNDDERTVVDFFAGSGTTGARSHQPEPQRMDGTAQVHSRRDGRVLRHGVVCRESRRSSTRASGRTASPANRRRRGTRSRA